MHDDFSNQRYCVQHAQFYTQFCPYCGTPSRPAAPERWKPQKGTGYYAIGADGNIDYKIWEGKNSDRQWWSFGNCFQTRQEAEHAREHMQEVLLNIHNEHP
jgi:hypothetical protein